MPVCSEPGCPEWVEKPGPCTTHKRERWKGTNAKRPSARAQGYDAKWEKTRREFLEMFSVCVDCGADATVADHDPVTRAELVSQGVPDPDAWHRLSPRCASCHSRKTVQQDGGFGRPPVK